MKQANYTTTYINHNWLIKVYGTNGDGNRINKLVGVSGLLALIGEELAAKFITRAINNTNGDFTRCCLRRGLVVTLYNK